MNDQDLDWLTAQQPQSGSDDRARERALTALSAHTSAPSARRTADRPRLRHPRVFGFAAAGGAAVAAVAVAVLTAVGGNPSGALPATAGVHLAGHPAGAAGNGHVAGGTGKTQAAGAGHVAKSPLVKLADYVSDSATPPGDATVVQRTTITGGQTVTVYDLYADNGEYFFSRTEDGLSAQVSSGNNLAGGLFAREIAAAKEAAAGNVKQGAQDMADAPDPSHVVPAQLKATKAQVKMALAKEKAIGEPDPSGANAIGTDYDNYVWENSQDALIAGSGDPQVRAGVLQMLATLPGVTVTQGTDNGQPTLVLTAGAYELGADYQEQLTINADTGVPIKFTGGNPSNPGTSVDYKVSRATFPGLQAQNGSAS